MFLEISCNDNLATSSIILVNKYSEINVRSDFVKKDDNLVFGLPVYGHLVNKFIDIFIYIIAARLVYWHLNNIKPSRIAS